MPDALVRQLSDHVSEILVIEEGYPYVERRLRGIILPFVSVRGKESGDIPADGELNSEIVWKAFGVEPPHGMAAPIAVPDRPPRLCDGCPHLDAYSALTAVLGEYPSPLVTSDIGCYTLGVLPPVGIGQSCVCMGASIGKAKGASEAGVRPVVAVIGDSTFLHSGITPLMDAVASNTDMTLLILDNDVVAMTGTQPTLLPSSRIADIVRGVGIHPEHCHVFESHPRRTAELTELLRREIAYGGLSVVIVHRPCIEAARRNRKARPS
jgi:indolepyruvate ferredoxin oxidoreductase alpha subunit